MITIPKCYHRQAEPVVLITGETVACVCVQCLETLPAAYVVKQLNKALAQAFCGHEDRIEISSLGETSIREYCTQCSEEMFMHDLIEAMSNPIRE